MIHSELSKVTNYAKGVKIYVRTTFDKRRLSLACALETSYLYFNGEKYTLTLLVVSPIVVVGEA